MLPTPYIKCDYNVVYEPSEDSFLLLDTLEEDQVFLKERFENDLSVVCELGPGSGIVTAFMMQNKIPSAAPCIYFAADISPWALEATVDNVRRNNCDMSCLEAIQCDLHFCLRKKEVDILVFNPPYVPAEGVPSVPATKEEEDDWLDLALLGGSDGMVITNKVLNELDDILTPNGVAYILFCARNKPEEVVKEMTAEKNWDVKLIMHRKAGWEVLSVYRFTR